MSVCLSDRLSDYLSATPHTTPLVVATPMQICEVLRADGLVYQEVEDLLEVGHELNPAIKQWDAACFDGHYVTGELPAPTTVLRSSGPALHRFARTSPFSLIAQSVSLGAATPCFIFLC